MAINKPGIAAWLLVGLAPLAVAEKAAQPDDDFLEYLGSMESSNDNWADLAASDDAKINSDEATDNDGSSRQSSSASSFASRDVHSTHSTNRSKQ